MRRALACALVCVVPRVAFAQAPVVSARQGIAEPVDPGAAEALFQKARPLMEKGKLDQACPIFEESYRLDPAPGTLLNLAACSRLTGKTATSWSQFVEAARSFRRKGDDRRAVFAEGQARELEPLLSYVVIKIETPPKGLVLKRDDSELTASSLDIKLPVDPGEHVVTANAPGHKTRIVRFTAEARKTLDVVIPALEEGEPDKAAPPAIALGGGTLGGGEPPGADGDASARRRTQQIAGFVVGGAGIASLVVGGVFVGLTAMKTSDTDDLCPDKRCTTPAGRASLDEANTFANVANGTLIAGAALLATAVVVYLTAPSDDPDSAALELVPGPASLLVRGRF